MLEMKNPFEKRDILPWVLAKQLVSVVSMVKLLVTLLHVSIAGWYFGKMVVIANWTASSLYSL